MTSPDKVAADLPASIDDAIDCYRRACQNRDVEDRPVLVRDAYADLADAIREEIKDWREAAVVMEHKVITCGVAASHPDASLTTRGAYANEWDSPQAESVRRLRAERDALLAERDAAQAVVDGSADAMKEMVRACQEKFGSGDDVDVALDWVIEAAERRIVCDALVPRDEYAFLCAMRAKMGDAVAGIKAERDAANRRVAEGDALLKEARPLCTGWADRLVAKIDAHLAPTGNVAT